MRFLFILKLNENDFCTFPNLCQRLAEVRIIGTTVQLIVKGSFNEANELYTLRGSKRLANELMFV